MIILYTGKQGAGKTYRVVSDILDKKMQEKFVIFHNIDGLKSEKFKQPEQVKDFRKVMEENMIEEDVFFSEDFQTVLAKQIKDKYNKPILLIVDEAYDYFAKHTDIKERFLSYHRHLGMRIMWICIQANQIHYKFRTMIAYEIRAKLSFPWAFVYQKYEGGVGTGVVQKLKKKEVFQAYKSYEIQEKKKFNATFLLIFAVVALGGTYYVWKSINMVGDKGNKIGKKNNVVSQAVQQNEKIEKKSNVMEEEVIKNYAYCGFIEFPNVNGQIVYKYIIENIDTGIQYNMNELFPELLPIYKSRSMVLCVDKYKKVKKRFIRLATDGAESRSLRGGDADGRQD